MVHNAMYTQFPLIRDRDTFWRLVKFLGKIRDRLFKFRVTIEIFTMKLPYNEAKFWDTYTIGGLFLSSKL